VRGMSLFEARSALSGASLTLGTIFYDETVITSDDSLVAVIYRQHPNPVFSFQTLIGSQVDIWLTTDARKAGNKEAEEELDF